MTDGNEWYYDPPEDWNLGKVEIWYENEWGDESFYGKGRKHKGKGKRKIF